MENSSPEACLPFILRFLGVQKFQRFVKSRLSLYELFFAWKVIAHPEICSPFFFFSCVFMAS